MPYCRLQHNGTYQCGPLQVQNEDGVAPPMQTYRLQLQHDPQPHFDISTNGMYVIRENPED